MVSNYNYLLKLWEQRNTLKEKVKAHLFEVHGGNARVVLSKDDIVQAVGQAFLITFTDLNEHVIRLTDDIILEPDHFLMEFTKYAKSKIQTKRLKRYGSTLMHSNNESPFILELLEKLPSSDFKALSGISGEPEEAIRQRHATGY